MMTRIGKILFTIAGVAIASAVIIGISIYQGAITIPDFGGNHDHAYGEPVGDVAAPSLNECVLNGHYYPVSSGNCTSKVTGAVMVAGCGGAGGVVAIMPNPTPTPLGAG